VTKNGNGRFIQLWAIIKTFKINSSVSSKQKYEFKAGIEATLAAIMKQLLFSLTFILLFSIASMSQSRVTIDSLLTFGNTVVNSRDLTLNPQAKQIINYGSKALSTLAAHFTDTAKSLIQSDCRDRYLTKGEVAIILADRIEVMPYFLLTRIQNCLADFCKDNPNLIEYYLDAIRRDSVEKFRSRYNQWLTSRERKNWPPHLARRIDTTRH
jgi:hypothetical protein